MRLWFVGVDCVSEGMRLARNRRAAAEGTDERGAAVLHAVLHAEVHVILACGTAYDTACDTAAKTACATCIDTRNDKCIDLVQRYLQR